MSGMEEFKGLSDDEQKAAKDLTLEAMRRRAAELGDHYLAGSDAAPVEAGESGAETGADSAYDEAGLTLPIAEELSRFLADPDGSPNPDVGYLD